MFKDCTEKGQGRVEDRAEDGGLRAEDGAEVGRVGEKTELWRRGMSRKRSCGREI